MDMIQTLINSISWEQLIKTGFTITLLLLLAWFASKILKTGLHRFEARLMDSAAVGGESALESQKRIETIVRLLRQGGLLALWLTLALMVLRQLGVEIGPIIASAGIAGLAVGFGAQNLVRDVIAGFFMILENQIRVGDVAIINGTGGLVEAINFRTTVLRDLSGVVHYFPNGSITSLSNLTNEWSAYVFDIGVAYRENTDEVTRIIQQVIDGMMSDDHFKTLIVEQPEIFGVDKLADSAVVIKGRIKTLPIQQWVVGREFLRRVKLAFDEHDIEIPFPHRTVYFGDASKPFDVRMLEAAANRNVASSADN